MSGWNGRSVKDHVEEAKSDASSAAELAREARDLADSADDDSTKALKIAESARRMAEAARDSAACLSEGMDDLRSLVARTTEIRTALGGVDLCDLPTGPELLADRFERFGELLHHTLSPAALHDFSDQGRANLIDHVDGIAIGAQAFCRAFADELRSLGKGAANG